MHIICSNAQILQCPNQACHASHLCGGLHRDASCHLLLPSETAHPKHWRGQEGQHCFQVEGFLEAEVLMDAVLEALEVHGHGRDAEPATAAAVPSGIIIPRRTTYSRQFGKDKAEVWLIIENV